MDLKRYFKAAGVGLGLFTLAVLASISPPTKQARAATPFSVDKVACFNGALTNSTAAVFTATSGEQIVVKGMRISASAASVIQFTDGSGGTPLYVLYLAQDTPVDITPTMLGGGFKTTAGTALHAYADKVAGATVRIAFLWNRE